MLLLLSITFILVRRTISQEEDKTELVEWYHAPNERGTWDIIISCVLTLTICVWSALHLNVPTADSKLRERNLRRVRWILLGIFSPELVVSTAFAQYLTARWLRREIRKDVQDRKSRASGLISEEAEAEWSITQCYFAVMGGITIQSPACISGHLRLSLTAEGVRLLSFLNRLPQVPERQISDKSKADGLAKLLVVLQAGWMILQTIARVNQKLPVTLLEINTIGHVLCAFALYLLWWSKPLEVKDPMLVLREEWMDSYVALMYMCSPICADKDDEISEIRCMAYIPPLQRGVQQPTASPQSPQAATQRTEDLREENPGKEKGAKNYHTKAHATRFSVGSMGARNPEKFIGPLGEFQVVSEEAALTPLDHNVRYVIKGQTIPTAREHEIFFALQAESPQYGLCHTRQYCRRAFSDCKNHDPLDEYAIERWRLANGVVDELWAECEKRPDYGKFFFTKSSLGTFVGEPIYIGSHVPNFLGLSYLGSVNVHRDRLKSILAFAGLCYGGLHLAAWNDYFPTQAERWLWIACSLTTGASGGMFALIFFLTDKIRALERVEYTVRNSGFIRFGAFYMFAPFFMMARIFIVVEAFISLRRAPQGIYQTPEWSNYVPHL